MEAIAKANDSSTWPKSVAWLPMAVMLTAAVCLAADLPAWGFMWALAFSFYAGLKWLSFADSIESSEATLGRSLNYLLLWPGMDAESFFAPSRQVEQPRTGEWFHAIGKLAFGASLIIVGVIVVQPLPSFAAWVGMVGIAFLLHFGLFHLLSVIWRNVRVDAPPIMDAPIMATSLADFWGKRWNLAFRDLAHTYVFRGFVGRLGVGGATIAVFLVSGLVHDAVISIPARGGYGLPTLYFLLQGVGVLFERSRFGKCMGIKRGVKGRLFCAAVTISPVCLLFHERFIERVIVPMLTALGGQ